MAPQKFKLDACKTCGAPKRIVNGAWLRWKRQQADLSLRDTAKRAGFSAVYLCDVEYNHRNCTPTIRAFYEGLKP